jgi:hypothetical protein
MALQFDELRQRLAARDLHFTHVAMKGNGQALYLLNGVFVSPGEAEQIAEDVDSFEAIWRRKDPKPDPEQIAWIATAQAVLPLAKAIYDVGKDGWERFKPSRHLRIDILNSTSNGNNHEVSLTVVNLTHNGIYIESVSIAKNVDKSQQSSISQPTVSMHPVRESTLGNVPKSHLPCLIHADAFQRFELSCPPILHNGQNRTYAVAELTYSKLDEAKEDVASFTFRLR